MTLGETIRLARLARGLSSRELAVQTGVTQASVSRMERGRDARWSSVRRVLGALPEIDVSVALTGAPRTRPVTERSWQATTEVLGLCAEHVTFHTRVDAEGRHHLELSVKGLRSLHGGLSLEETLLELAGAAGSGGHELLDAIESATFAPGRTTRVESDGVLHEWVVPDDPLRDGIDYRGTAEMAQNENAAVGVPVDLPFEHGTSVLVDYPARRLVLRVELAAVGRTRVVPWAWPASQVSSPESPVNRWEHLYPSAPSTLCSGEDGDAELVVDRPVPGMLYSASWDDAPAPEAPSSARVGPSDTADVAEALRLARRRAGLSRRGLAKRIGCSASTVSRLEDGADATVSQVRALLDALPQLSPYELLEPTDRLPERTELWTEQAALHGCAAEEKSLEACITTAGHADVTDTTRSLSWSPHAGGVRLRHGLTAPSDSGRRWELQSVSVTNPEDAEASIRVRHRDANSLVHDMRLPESGGGADVVRHYKMRLPKKTSLSESTFYVAPAQPCRVFRISVQLPPSSIPKGATLRCIPRALIPRDGEFDLLDDVHPEGASLCVDQQARTVSFAVNDPLVGLRYALSWRC